MGTARARRFLSAALVLAACASPRPAPPPVPSVPPPAAAPANLELRLSEVVERAELDGLSYAKVFVGGQERGLTSIAPRSQVKRWEGFVPPGNHPVRLEVWVLPGTGDWERLADDAQPRERFVRVEDGTRAVLALRRHPSGRYDYDLTRQTP